VAPSLSGQMRCNLKIAPNGPFFVMYGPTDHRMTEEFLLELAGAISVCPLPLVVGETST
jgi:hypothetical protein